MGRTLSRTGGMTMPAGAALFFFFFFPHRVFFFFFHTVVRQRLYKASLPCVVYVCSHNIITPPLSACYSANFLGPRESYTELWKSLSNVRRFGWTSNFNCHCSTTRFPQILKAGGQRPSSILLLLANKQAKQNMTSLPPKISCPDTF